MKSQEDLIQFARESLGLPQSAETELISYPGRGSDRSYFRFKWAPANSAILVRYQTIRIENCYFADIAAFLHENGIPVPRLILHDASAQCILMEDLGDKDLWALRQSSWELRQKLYQKTLIAAHKLHSLPEESFPSGRVKLMEPCGPAFYLWEREYFRDNFIKALCRIDLDPYIEQQLESELSRLSARIESHQHCLMHRDLQSQNVMIFQDEPYLIDFQGMRFGSRFYDLGSLLCDPYVGFADNERTDLLSFYYRLSQTEMDWGNFQRAFWDASVERLLQALGCYGYLGLTKGLRAYLTHVPAGFRNLRLAAENAGDLPFLLEICEKFDKAIRDLKFEIRD
ncbi:MAG: aminoglycoside phosphotransferase family protein [Acidobacteria bacterium]|nr:aminoglycoside phosphotransferase family protein [Acidobacteriota bacterium]